MDRLDQLFANLDRRLARRDELTDQRFAEMEKVLTEVRLYLAKQEGGFKTLLLTSGATSAVVTTAIALIGLWISWSRV